jgi:hypothetical protein
MRLQFWRRSYGLTEALLRPLQLCPSDFWLPACKLLKRTSPFGSDTRFL